MKKKEKSTKGRAKTKTTVVLPKEIDLNYVKTPNYRTFHVDGIFGGLTTQGKLYIELFLERTATPKLVKHKVTPDGRLGNITDRQGLSGIIREIESGLIMDVSVAESLRDWLTEKIDDYNEQSNLLNQKDK